MVAVCGRRSEYSQCWLDKKMRLSKFNCQKGFGFVETILAIGVTLTALMFLGLGMKSFNQSKRKTVSETDLSLLKADILRQIDCDKTFAPLGLPKGRVCATDRYLTLRARSTSNDILVPSAGGRVGDWVVRALCTGGAGGGLDVRALGILPGRDGVGRLKNWAGGAPPRPASNYRKDEITGQPYDWTHPKSRLFVPGANGLCSEWFGTPLSNQTACPAANQFVKDVNLGLRSATCGTIPNCTAGALIHDGNGFVCSSAVNDSVTALVNSTTTTLISTLNTNVTDLSNSINYVNGRFATLGLGPETSVKYSDDWHCQRLALMRCPDGYLMWRYEARLSENDDCTIGCRKVVP